MTLLWELNTEDTHYSVRTSGASIRLYSNRVFHSQWNPNKPFAGGVWDCLSLPTLYRPADYFKRVLLLGVGGGAVIRQLQQLIDFDTLSAIEIDEHHLHVARHWFGIDDSRVDLQHGDAIDWLINYRGQPFDLIIDDLFGHSEGEPLRACALSGDWLDALSANLKDSGLLVVNCVDSAQLKRALPEFDSVGFRYGFRWTLPTYENAIGVLSRTSLRARDWSRNLEYSELDGPTQRQARLTIRRPLRGLGQQP
ncbi:MAG: spermidine synthase [Granulosicoccus sp.]